MMKILIFIVFGFFLTLSFYSQDITPKTSTNIYADTLVFKTGERVIVQIVSIEENAIEYAINGDENIHYASFYIVDEVKFEDGDIYINNLENVEKKNLKIMGLDPTKRKGHFIINSYLSSLIRRDNAKNNLCSFGTMYYFNSQFSIGAAYQLGLKDNEIRPYAVHIDKIIDFNIGWSKSTYRKIDLGVRSGFQITYLNQNFTTVDRVSAYGEKLDQNVSYGHLHEGIYYDFIDYSNQSVVINALKKAITRPYLGIECNIQILPVLSFSSMVALTKSDNLYLYKDYSVYYESIEYYDLNGDLVEITNEGYHEDNYYHYSGLVPALFLRLSLNYHFCIKSVKLK